TISSSKTSKLRLLADSASRDCMRRRRERWWWRSEGSPVSSSMSNLRIGVPSKGRLSDLAAERLKQAGLNFRRQERSLFARVGEMPVDITFLRTDDIPVLCAEGAIDMGITGSDLVAEAGVDVLMRLALGIGKCKLALCVPDESPIEHARQ